MTTTTVKTIGTGGDYTTLQSWEDAAPANLVTSDVVWQGQCFNQEFFSSSAALLTVSGTTTDATRYKELTTYAGASFVDNASVQTNALRYNASNGAGIRSTYAWSAPVGVSESYFRISKLQILSGTAVAFNGSATTGLVMDKCIVENSGTSNEALKTYGACTVKNTLVVGRSTGVVALLSNGTNAYNCTFARTGSSTSNIFNGSYSTSTLKNCAFFGGATTLAGGSTSKTYTTCYTDTASPPSGCTTVAYDTSTGSGFENKTDATRDFRIKTGSALLDVGTTDATNAANDIAGTARPSGSAYDVGAWELVAAGGDTYTLTADTANIAIAGQATGLAFNRVLAADTANTPVAGQSATLAFNRVLAADTANIPLAGQNVTLTYTPIGGPTYTLTADTASIAVSGTDTNLTFNRKLVADTANVPIAGAAATLARGYTLAADTANVAVSASDAALIATRKLIAESMAIALAGADATLTYTPLTLPTVGRPTSDTSNTGWTPSTGVDLYPMVDEVTPDALDYISTTAIGSICKMALSTTAYPGTASQQLKFRASSSTGNSVIVRLKEGATTIRSATQVLTAVDTEYTLTLTSGEIAAITSGSLSVELESA